MTVDIKQARALVERGRGGPDISIVAFMSECADTIAALLDERERLIAAVNALNRVDTERDALERDAARYREFVVSGGWHRHIDGEHPEESYSYLLVGLPVDADLSCYTARKIAMDKVLDEGSER